MAKRGWIEERTGARGVSFRVRYWAPNVSGELVPRSKSFGEWQYGGRRAAEDKANLFLAQMLTDVRSGSFLAPSETTVREVADQWLADHEPRIAGSTVNNYLKALNHLRPSLGSIPIQHLKPLHIQRLYRELRADGVGEGMMRQLHIVLNAVCRQAMAWDLLLQNPMTRVPKPEPKSKPIQYWTAEQSALFLELEGSAPDFGVAWTLLLFTGMRVGELLALRWSDFDPTRGTLRIERTMTRDRDARVKVGTTTKTPNSVRTIPLPGPCLDAMKQHRIRQRERRLKASRWDLTDGDLIFTRDDGRFVPPNALSRVFLAAVGRTDLPRIKPHGMRHSVATSMLISGVHPKIVAELLGDTVEMILRVYSHVTFATKVDAMTDHAERLLTARAALEQAADATT